MNPLGSIPLQPAAPVSGRAGAELGAIVQAAIDGCLIASDTGEILDLNESAARLLGFRRVDLLGTALAQLSAPGAAPSLGGGLTWEPGTSSGDFHCMVRRRDGSSAEIEASAAVLGVGRSIVYLRDASARKRADERLRQLSRAVEQSPVSIIITDKAGRIEYVNPHFEEVTGYSAAEVLGQTPRLLKSGERSAESYRELWTTLAEGRQWRGEFHNRRKDGTLYWETAAISPVRDDGGRITHYVGVKEDVTEQKLLAERQRWTAAIVENAADICSVKDLHLRVLSANPAFARAVGVAHPAELTGKTDAEIFDTKAHPTTIAGYMEDDRKAQQLAPSEILITEEQLFLPNGETRTLLTRKFPVFDADGAVIATANISTDISERKRNEEQTRLAQLQLEHSNRQLEASAAHARELAFKAEAANRAKSAFLANMSHELRTPLNVINGLAATLGEQSPDSDEARAAQLIVQSGQTLLGTIEKLLDFSGLQAGETKLSIRAFQPVGVLAEALRQAREAIGNRPIRLSYRIAPDLPFEAVGDPQRLQLILGNLLNNAAKFTSVGRIHLALKVRELSREQFVLEATVYDTGSGITDADQRRLFQPFARGAGACARHDPGTGLGLTIAKAFAQLMGGTITVRSRLGAGSAFRCRVVLGRPPQQPPALAQLTPTAWVERRMLAVSDDPSLLRTVRDFARVWRIDLTTAATAAEAAALLPKADAFGLTLLDADQGTLAALPTSGPVFWLHRASVPPPPPATARALRWPCAPDQLAAEIQNASIAITLPSPAVRTRANSKKLSEEIPLRVLVADDMATNREMIRRMLLHLGYSATMAENGIEVLSALDRQTFDLLILDVQMPEMDGLEASREIVRRQPDPGSRPKIVALTANVLPGSREACIEAGMDDYLSKPVLPQQLRDCIRRHFRVSPDAAPPPPAPTPANVSSETPLVDPAHLAAVLSGLPSDNLQEMLADLHATAVADYEEQRPRLAATCATRDHAKMHELVHGLKGCFAMLGWARLAERCAHAQAQTKQGDFTEWESFPANLHQLYEQSEAAMQPYLKNGVPPELLQAALAADLS